VVKEKIKYKRILVITEVYFPEEFLINEVVDRWSTKDDIIIDVLTRNPSYPYGKIFSGYNNKLYSTSKFNNVKVHRYHIIQGYKDSTFIKIVNYLWNAILSAVISLIKFRKVDSIFIYHTGPLTMAFSGIILKKISRAKLTIWTQDIWPETIFAYGIKKNYLLEKIIKTYVRWVYKNCDEILVSALSFKKSLSKYTDKEIKFVPNWANSVFLKPLPESIFDKSDPTFNYTFAGNIGKVQNLETVIKSFAKWNTYPNVKLNIYGDGSELNNLKKITEENSIKNVIFWGRLPLKKMPEIFANSDCLIISLEEDSIFDLYLPAKFSSYLSSGKPILGVIGGDVNKLINENKVGISVGAKDENKIIDAFDKIYNLSEDDRATIKKNSKILFEKYFEKYKNIKTLENIVFYETD